MSESAERAREERRNIVLIISDTLRPDYLHAYGADFIPTPNIDALAANGIVLDNTVTPSTVCAPARASILTGRNVSGHDGWTNGMPLRADAEFFPQRLTDAGYVTAAFGGLDHARPEKPMGYQYIRRLEMNNPGGEYLTYLRSRHPEAKGCAERDPQNPYRFRYPESDLYDRWTCDRVTEFFKTFAQTRRIPADGHGTGVPSPENTDAPFFALCNLHMPHEPFLPPAEVSGRVDIAKLPPIHTVDAGKGAEVERNRRAFLNTPEQLRNEPQAVAERMRERLAYCEMICEVDDLVGRIVSSLKENGLYENTTILFTADHGSVQNDYNLITKGPWPYTPQLFVPLILSNHPGLSGRASFMSTTLDIGATVLDIAGDRRGFGISRSLIGQCLGTVPVRERVMSEFCDSCKTIADRRYTFTYYPFTGKTVLYDRVNDPFFTEDLSGRPETRETENAFLKEIIDYMVLAKGVRIEAHDMVTSVRKGIGEKDLKFLDHFDIAYPLASMAEVERLKEAGLPWDIDEFCRDRPIRAHYGVYFTEEKKK